MEIFSYVELLQAKKDGAVVTVKSENSYQTFVKGRINEVERDGTLRIIPLKDKASPFVINYNEVPLEIQKR